MTEHIARMRLPAASLGVTPRLRYLGRRVACSFAPLASTVMFGAVAANARANTVYVDDDASVGGNGTSWASAFADLQDALAVASPGTEIWVAQGTYSPSDCDGGACLEIHRTETFQLKNGVALYGGYAGLGAGDPDLRDIVTYRTFLYGDLAGNDVYVDCVDDSPDCSGLGGLCADGSCIIPDQNDENSYHVVTGSGTDGTAVLDGFTIIAGNANEGSWPDPTSVGGGMLNSRGSPTVSNCTFSGNSAADAGGGMLNDRSDATVTHCTFSGNSAVNGGGLYNAANSPTVANCTFSENTAGFGGGIFNGDGDPLVSNCAFTGNLANQGGAILNARATPTITGCAFTGNSGAVVGGAMENQESTAIVTNCTFCGNRAHSGGGVFSWPGSILTVSNCAFSGNSADFSGGGMVNWDSSPAVSGCTFSGNSAANAGGGMLNLGSSSSTVNNSIFWQNSDAGGKDESAQIHDDETSASCVNFSDLQGGWTGACGTGNIDADPMFVDTDDSRLGSGSPCIGAGDPAVMFVLGETDLDGHARVLCGRVDMGAYEFGIGDHKCDRDVDLFDFANWADCMTGPEKGPFAEGCEAFDFDGDLDVDLEDFGGFQRMFMGG